MGFDVIGNKRVFIDNIWGGLASMLVAIPSSIAFGVTIFSALGVNLAAQGAVAGILGTAALGLVSPTFGGSSRLITAPCAPAAAVLSALAIGFVHDGISSGTILLMLGLIGLLAGIMQIGLGVLGVGKLIKFVPYPVVSGYLSGVGLLIIGSQIPHFLGASHGKGLIDAVMNPADWAWQSVLVGLAVGGTMIVTPRITNLVPAAIVALLAGIGVYLALAVAGWAAFSPENNPLLIGTLPSSPLRFMDSLNLRFNSVHSLGLKVVVDVLVPAMTLAALSSIDTLKTCLVTDAMTNTHHNSNKELVGQGLGNIASALVGGVPGSGTMGATMINIASGGTSKISGIMEGVFALGAYFIFAPMIAWIPVSALAALLIVIGFRMIDRHSLAFFFAPSTRLDFLVILSVILVAIFGDLIAASGVGVAVSMVLFIREQIRGSVVHSRIEGKELLAHRVHLLAAKDYLNQQSDKVVVIELQGSLFFGTASQLLDALESEIATRKYVILSMRRVHSLDVTATHVLEQIKDRLEEYDAYLIFCDIPKGLPSGLKMKKFLKETGVVRPTTKALAFRQLDDAVEWVESEMLAGFPEPDHSTPMDLAQMPLFAGCSAPTLAALEDATYLRSIKEGKKLFKPDEESDELFFIRQGLVKVSLSMGKKDDYHFATCGPGELIGGMGFLDKMNQYAEAEALTDMSVYVLPRSQFEILVRDQAHVAVVILEALGRSLSNRLRFSINQLHALRQ